MRSFKYLLDSSSFCARAHRNVLDSLVDQVLCGFGWCVPVCFERLTARLAVHLPPRALTFSLAFFLVEGCATTCISKYVFSPFHSSSEQRKTDRTYVCCLNDKCIAVILPRVQDHFDVPPGQIGTLTSATMLGMMIVSRLFQRPNYGGLVFHRARSPEGLTEPDFFALTFL